MRLLFFLLLVSAALRAQDITRVEYFFDTDPGFGNGISIPVTAAPDLTQNFTVPLNTVSNGFHRFYIRAKSSTAQWSIPQSHPVFVFNNTATFITRVEYFFDTDPGLGNGISVPITSAVDVSKDFTIPLTTISPGFHSLHLRAKSMSGQWSLLLGRTVFVQVNTQSNAPFPLKKIEYFLDTDPGFGNGTSLSVSNTQVDQTIVADLSSATLGFHILYMRSQDVNNRWSLPYTKPFFVTKSGSNIVALEYYYTDGTTQSPVRIYNSFTPSKDLTIDFTAVLDGLLPNTSYEIHVTAINADGLRSAEAIHTFVTPTVVCDPLSPPLTTGASRCESGVVNLTATGATATQSYHWYTNASTLMPIANVFGNSFTTPGLSSNTSYFVSIVNGTCESNRTEVIATILSCNQAPQIATSEFILEIESIAQFDLATFITDVDNNLDLATLSIVTPPSNAIASLNGTVLTLDYSNSNFIGTESIELSVCDLLASCEQQTLSINVVAEIEIYNAVSPNDDGKNDSFLLRYINIIPETQNNRVTIYNRWGDTVFEVSDYDNVDKVFTGLNSNGKELPSGTYFYKIEFTSGRKTMTGFLSLRR